MALRRRSEYLWSERPLRSAQHSAPDDIHEGEAKEQGLRAVSNVLVLMEPLELNAHGGLIFRRQVLHKSQRHGRQGVVRSVVRHIPHDRDNVLGPPIGSFAIDGSVACVQKDAQQAAGADPNVMAAGPYREQGAPEKPHCSEACYKELDGPNCRAGLPKLPVEGADHRKSPNGRRCVYDDIQPPGHAHTAERG
jgi:hypothetical protein